MARVKTFTNGGSVLPGDLNAIQDDYEFAFAGWRPIAQRSGWLDGASTATCLLSPGGGAASASVVGYAPVIDLSQLDNDPNGRDLQIGLITLIAINAVTPGGTLTITAEPVAESTGSSGNPNFLTSGGGAAITLTQALSSNTANFSPSSLTGVPRGSDRLVLTAKPSATFSAGARVSVLATLLARYV